MKNKPLTILFDANSLMVQRTGVGYYTAGLIEAMAKQRPDVQFVGYFYNFLGRKQPPQAPKQPNISYRPILAFPGPVVNLLRRFRIEVPLEILTGVGSADFVIYPNFLSQPSLHRTPNAPVIHDLVYHDHPDYGSDKSVRDLTRFVPRSLQRASFVLTVSQDSRQRIHDVYGVADDNIVTTFIPPQPVHTIVNAAEMVAEQGIDKPYLLFLGTLEPRKNIVNLLEAYTRLPAATRQQYSLVLAGKIDWKYQETKQKLESLQAEGYDIHYLGYVDDDMRAALYQRARLFVMASHYEGFGMQTLEALQYGVPCALSDLPVLHEVGGDAVAYFNQEDPDDISAVIQRCLTDKVNSANLKQHVASQPDWPQVADLVLARILSTINRK
jgi:glycosyltransferase involved in cell wall biosynthesis